MSIHVDRRLRAVLAVVITAVWVVSFVVDLFVVDYDPPTIVGTLMLLVAGALFGEGVVRQVKQTPEDSNDR